MQSWAANLSRLNILINSYAIVHLYTLIKYLFDVFNTTYLENLEAFNCVWCDPK